MGGCSVSRANRSRTKGSPRTPPQLGSGLLPDPICCSYLQVLRGVLLKTAIFWAGVLAEGQKNHRVQTQSRQQAMEVPQPHPRWPWWGGAGLSGARVRLFSTHFLTESQLSASSRVCALEGKHCKAQGMRISTLAIKDARRSSAWPGTSYGSFLCQAFPTVRQRTAGIPCICLF